MTSLRSWKASSLGRWPALIPFLLVLTGWYAFQTARPDRYRGLPWLLCGAALASIPLAYLAILSPSQTWFGIVEYHLFHRADQWMSVNVSIDSMTRYNLHQILQWTTSTQGVLLVFLSLAGLPFIFDSKTPTSTRYLLQYAASVALGLALFLSLPRPTFFIYYVLVIPYVCLLASAGLWGMATRMWSPRWASILLVGTVILYSNEVIRPIIAQSLSMAPDCLVDLDETARQINAVTSPNDPVYADAEAIYVVARRLPPRGLENSFGAAIRLPLEEYARAGLVPPGRIEAQLRAGSFAAVALSKTPDNERPPTLDPRIQVVRTSQLYAGYIETKMHVIFWKLAPPLP